MSEDKECRQMESCPYCAGALIPYCSDFAHPANDCWLSAVKIMPHEFARWNRRAAKPAVPTTWSAEKERIYNEGYQDGKELAPLARDFERQIATLKSDQFCEWEMTDFENAIWESSCGEAYTFIDGGPKENGVKFCHGCGKPMIEVRPEDPDDSEPDATHTPAAPPEPK